MNIDCTKFDLEVEVESARKHRAISKIEQHIRWYGTSKKKKQANMWQVYRLELNQLEQDKNRCVRGGRHDTKIGRGATYV